MSKLDQFESVFKSAVKTGYHHQSLDLKEVWVVTDLDKKETKEFTAKIKTFLSEMSGLDSWNWRFFSEGQWDSVDSLIQKVQDKKPDLVCTYRHLKSLSEHRRFSMGEAVVLLTQATDTPVLLLPRPEVLKENDRLMPNTKEVMAITDHLTGDDRLLHYGVHFTQKEGTLFLSHIEDQEAFDYYIEAFSKTPDIDTDVAKEALREQLLKEPSDYVESCIAVLKEEGLEIEIKKIVEMGKRLTNYKRLVSELEVDLLIMNSKDENQHAMDRLAYSLTIEVRNIPILLL